MINLFNLFLFLLLFWLLLILTDGQFSIALVVTGMVVSALISLICWRAKIINKNFNFLFLNLGFFRHFLALFFKSWFRALWFLFYSSVFLKKNEDFIIRLLPKRNLNKSELSIFLATISFLPGISCLHKNSEAIILYVVHKKFFYYQELKKIYHNIDKINDDSLV